MPEGFRILGFRSWDTLAFQCLLVFIGGKIILLFPPLSVLLFVVDFPGLTHNRTTGLITKASTCLFHIHFFPEINLRLLVHILAQSFYRLEFLTLPITGFCILIFCYRYNFCHFVITQVSESGIQEIFKDEENDELGLMYD